MREVSLPDFVLAAIETLTDAQRRKKQNRLAQQAFRGRQKVRVDSLESEWQQLRTLHEGLNQAYAQRTKEVEQLQKRVEQLLQDIDFLRSSQEVETWWPSSPSATSSPSSWTSSPKQQYTPQQTDPYPTSGFDMQQFFGEDGFSQYADFSLSSNLYETY